MLIATSPSSPTPPSSVFGSPHIATSQTSISVHSPSRRISRFATFCHDDDSDDDLENIDPRMGPFTPCKGRGRRVRKSSPTPSPSKFIVKGTVTPSRAAPLFTRHTTKKRIIKRAAYYDSMSSEDEDEEMSSETGTSSELNRVGNDALSQSQYATLLPEVLVDYPIPKMQIPDIDMFRPMQATENTATYLMSIRSNSLHHSRQYASLRGIYGGSPGRGVLGVSRMLGAGGGYTHVSQRPFNMSLQTHSLQSEDLFVVPSNGVEVNIAHPLCAEYSHSSRSLDNTQAQWLAVGDNEGCVNLLNTLAHPMAVVDTNINNKPKWCATTGSVFELKWRFDDEMIATGGSDYTVRVWSPASGDLIRTFKGHRGSPRTLAWDPNGSGFTLASAGRDGAIHLYDLRAKDGSRDGETFSPCLSIWDAHRSDELIKKVSTKGQGGRKKVQLTQPKAVTSITYLPGRGASLLASAGCADGRVKLWDLRYGGKNSEAAGGIDVSAYGRKESKKQVCPQMAAIDESQDLTRKVQRNKSSHGISHIVAGSNRLYAACTDGSIYTMSCADLLQPCTTPLGHPTYPLFHEVQKGNTLFARMALHDNDRTLALGCNSGVVTVWDTHAATLSLGEVQGQDEKSRDVLCSDEDRLTSRVAMSRPAILNNGHSENFEINSVTWAHGPKGPVLTSVSDDYSIRLWHSTPRTGTILREHKEFIDMYTQTDFP